MENNIYDNEEELVQAYTKLHRFVQSDSFLDAAPDADLLSQLKSMETAIQRMGLFSPNEEYDEIREELLPFVDLPFLLAQAYNKEPGADRKSQLTHSATYYNIFLELCKHFKILPDHVKKVYKEFKTKENYRIEREDKIALYKEEKQLKDELGKFKQGDKEKAKIQTQINCFQTINSLLFIPQELEILSFKDKLNTDKDFKEKYEAERAMPPEKLKFFKLDKQDEGQTINSNDIKDANPKLHAKQDIRDKLFQHNYAQPVMTLDEHSDLEYRLMMEKQQRNEVMEKQYKEEMKQLGIKDPENSDEEIVNEIKTYKERAWDDWKDENEKGAGNRAGK